MYAYDIWKMVGCPRKRSDRGDDRESRLLLEKAFKDTRSGHSTFMGLHHHGKNVTIAIVVCARVMTSNAAICKPCAKRDKHGITNHKSPANAVSLPIVELLLKP